MATADQKKLWELSQQGAATTEGVARSIVSWSDRLVEIDVGGLLMVMPWAGSPPWPDSRVRVITAGKLVFCAPILGASIGTVQSVASGTVTVLGEDGRVYSYPHLGTAPAVSALVRIDHIGRVILSGAYSVTPPGSSLDTPDPIVPPAPTGGSAWFNPIWSGNWSGGSFAGDAVEVSSTRVGLYGYGTQIANTIPDGATINRAELHLTENWDRVPGTASSMGTHGFDGRPGAGVDNGDLAGTTSVPGLVQDIKGAVADALKTGAALGVGFRSGSTGWRQYGTAPGSGRIYMEWS